MKAGTSRKATAKILSAVIVIALLAVLLPSGAALTNSDRPGPSSFDVYAPFRSNTVSAAPATSVFQVKVRAIKDAGELLAPERFYVDVSATSDSRYLTPVLDRSRVLILRARPEVTMALRVKSTGAPQGTQGWVTLTARRGAEVHKLYFEILVQDAKPGLALGTIDGAQEQPVRLNDGRAFEVNLVATNKGAATTTFPLTASAPAGWTAYFVSESGMPINSVQVTGIIPYVLFSPTAKIKAVIDPPAEFSENPGVDVTLSLGDAPVVVKVARKGLLWSANDMNGLYPHVHQVASGNATTYKMTVSNKTTTARTARLSARGAPLGWRANLSRSLIYLAPGESQEVVLSLKTATGAPAGQGATVTVTANVGGASDTVALAARVNNTPKVYYFSIDSMSYSYMTFNAAGQPGGKTGDWLMKNVHDFMGDSVAFTNANSLMPSATDMNHTSALSGCFPGTEGIYCVSTTMNGTTPQGRMETQATSLDQGWTVDEEGNDVKIQRIYELAKQANPEALCAFLSNKAWLVDLESNINTQTAVERSVSSTQAPLYMPNVSRYVLGDPPTDNDPALDPMQKNLIRVGASHMLVEQVPNWRWPDSPTLPTPLLNMFGINMFSGMDDLTKTLLLPGNLAIGSTPGGFCSDNYIGDSLISMIEQEDPDVTYTNLGALDETGHLVGSAEDPSEWDSNGTGANRDDMSAYSNYALRDDAIDVAREADAIFGRFINTLKARGVYDSSVIVVLSDHGMQNYKRPEKGYQVLDNRNYLREKGYVMGTDYDYQVGAMDYDLIYSKDKKNLVGIEEALQAYTVDDPVLGKIRPMVVFNREEMKTGIDVYTEQNDPDRAAKITVQPGEFYSEYWVARDGLDHRNMKWPDLVVYGMEKYFLRIYSDIAVKGANMLGIKADMQLPPEISIMATGGHLSFNTRHIPLVFKAPGMNSPTTVDSNVYLTDIAPSIYQIMGWTTPEFVDGNPLPLY